MTNAVQRQQAADPSGSHRGRRSLAGLLLVAAAVACAPADRDDGPGEPARTRVVVSVPPLAWFVRELGGEAVEVTVMVPPGASPALYDPTFAKMRAVSEADLYVAVGHPRFPFERAWLDELTAGHPDLRLVRSGAGCVDSPADPHLWMSPGCARAIADSVAGALGRAMPEGAATVAERHEHVRRRIDEVDRELASALTPYRGRSFLVFHPALGYFARSYDLEQMAIERGAAEPSPSEVAAIVREARREGIRHVLVQPQFSSEAARLVAAQLPDGELATVDPLAGDWPAMMRSVGATLVGVFTSRTSGPGTPSGGTR